MISLRQSIKELDTAEVAHQAAVAVFADALEASAAHAVEVNRQETEEFREQLRGLAVRVGHSQVASELDAARSRFRVGVRDYAAKAHSHVRRLREELEAAGTAMQAFAQGVSTSTGDHETVLRREFRQLEESAESEDIRGVRAAVHETVHVVTESYEGLKQAQALVIVQLRDEIRVLQRELERGKTKPELPAGVVAKHELDREVDELMRQDRAFVVVLAGIPDAEELYQRFPRAQVNGAVAAMVESLLALARQRLPKAVIGAWGTHLYGVVVTTDVSLKEWGAELAASHQSQVDGTPRTLRIVPRLEVVERKRGESPSAFFDRLAAASETPTNS